MYNQRTHAEGDQSEIDVIGVDNTDDGEQVVYTCEVVTHLNGLHYSGHLIPTGGLNTGMATTNIP